MFGFKCVRLKNYQKCEKINKMTQEKFERKIIVPLFLNNIQTTLPVYKY